MWVISGYIIGRNGVAFHLGLAGSNRRGVLRSGGGGGVTSQ